MRSRPILNIAPALLALCLLAAAAAFLPGGRVHAEDKLVVVSKLTYDLSAGNGSVHVTWDADITDNDPTTQNQSQGQIFFYDSLRLPILRGAGNASAVSSGGAPLNTTIDSSGDGVAVVATVHFEKRLFYQDKYHFTLVYDLANVQSRSLLVTQYYTFLPALAAGSQATVTVKTPDQPPWAVDFEPVDCKGDTTKMTCPAGDNTSLAAIVEISRPDAMAVSSFDVALKQKTLKVSVAYFKGEEAFAQHLKALASAALPVEESVYGVTYTGPVTLKIAQGGRQQILGYEGLTSCQASCTIIVSPIADDLTILHELSHIWSSMFAKRWLSEGFAEFVAEQTASRLPAGLVGPPPPATQAPNVDLQLDDWGPVTSVLGAQQSDLQVQAAGYDRSLRFLTLLESQLGLDSLEKANAAIAASAHPADSRGFMDALEDAGGTNVDDQFQLWVFPQSMQSTLQLRRQARDRYTALERSIQGTGLSQSVPGDIHHQIAAWNFDDALRSLDQAEAGLKTYDQLLPRLDALKAAAQGAGLSLTSSIQDRLLDWKFDEAALLLDQAEQTLQAYKTAWTKVRAPRNVWEKFGLLGSDPKDSLRDSAAQFGRGDYTAALASANHAASLVDGASGAAFRRLLIVSGIFGLLALALGVAFWLSRWRQRRAAF